MPARPRADARANRQRLLAEADAVFREQGTGASLEAIAKRAGLAIGTLYGHFPNRRALLGALMSERNEDLFTAAEALSAEPPEVALRTWISMTVTHAATYSGLATHLITGTDDVTSELHASCTQMAAIVDALVRRAVDAGVIRPTTTGADLHALTTACAWAREHSSPEQADRLIDLAFLGILV
ncbi:TetR/AcrR family transcriptional regulator [Actinokineospora diospyrosa]|uniref:Transcriptional regulator, TetR family n=1 Tax=Actinokineospora diospyrosa TaxID=103728 RepID=A0ABT1IMQ3_9PSEU|nr:TetR/AcrR family transcriptional regulator [Actinokineospora diospyrosa]MCP2273920.1 transcriptional regulator, TetR family [Actinokineospora diospyrosa]